MIAGRTLTYILWKNYYSTLTALVGIKANAQRDLQTRGAFIELSLQSDPMYNPPSGNGYPQQQGGGYSGVSANGSNCPYHYYFFYDCPICNPQYNDPSLSQQPQHQSQNLSTGPLSLSIPLSPSSSTTGSTTFTSPSLSPHGTYPANYSYNTPYSPASPLTGPISPSQTGGSYPQFPRHQVGSAAGTTAALNNRTKPATFFCEVQGCPSKGFTERHNLLYHTRSHQNVRPYVCEKCGRAFTSRSDLTRHVTKSKKPCVERNTPNHYLGTPLN
ncbi:hypothetical protein PM082_022577 [Marasmius tenuissimus]|nr:hypothetical protein PM082_022577 [Marasmius tenuissimus]